MNQNNFNNNKYEVAHRPMYGSFAEENASLNTWKKA